MKIKINTDLRTFSIDDNNTNQNYELYSKEAFELISDLWLKTSWNQKYSYTFTWLGRPIIQHPEDLVRLQEVIYNLKPDVIVETGVAHGGSLIFYAGLMQNIGKGKVVGVDIEIRPHNRTAIESHPLSNYISLIEGDSASNKIVEEVGTFINEGDTVLVILDSNHSYEHVLKELNAYHNLVTKGSYIIATDGIMKYVYDTPLGDPSWIEDNPVTAVTEFLQDNTDFVLEEPKWLFNESRLNKIITGWPYAWLKKI